MKAADRWLQQLRLAQVIPYVRAGARVLDIGCADGALLRAAPSLAQYVGIDPDAPQGAEVPGVRYVRGTFPSAPIDDELAFDVVTALAVLEHVPPAELAAFAQSAARRLKPDGLLVMTVPHPFVDVILDVLLRLRLLDGMETDQHHGFDPRTTRGLFEPHGFELVQHKRFELGLNHLFVFRRSESRA